MPTRLPSCLPGLALALTGCATIIHGSTQDIAILSAPAGAQVSVDGAPAGRTPLTARLGRKRGHQVRFEAAGYRPYEVTVIRHASSTAWADALFGIAAVVAVPIDVAWGGFYELEPRSITAWLTADSTAPRAEGQTAAAAAPVQGQPAPTTAAGAPGPLESVVMVGSRVRVSQRDRATPLVGRVTAVRGDTLEVLPDGGGAAVALPLGAMARLERSFGRRGHGLAGAGIGLAAGALVGGLVGSAAYRPCTQTGMFACMFAPASRGEAAALGAGLGGVAGVVVGLVIGAQSVSESWQTIPLADLPVTVTPLRGGRTGLGLALRVRLP